MQIGDRIKARRIELGLTQDELAKKLGYKSRSTINKIELNINDITQPKIIDFAAALDTTVSYLMGLDSDTSEKSLSAIIGEEAIQMILDNDEKTRIVKWIATQDPEVLSLVHWISLQDRDTLIRLDQILSLSRKQ
nr:MAG TPA: helix-turn-helix domain protein [Caudoviricetes sp.]